MSSTQQVTTTTSATETSPLSQMTNRNEELVIHLAATSSEPRVRWTNDTVDNEFAGKKKSKCCCIYKKSKTWGESDGEDSDCETGNCRGHVEKRHTHKQEN